MIIGSFFVGVAAMACFIYGS